MENNELINNDISKEVVLPKKKGVKKGYKQTSEHIRKRFENRIIPVPWSKGLTKETNESIARCAKKIKEYSNTPEGKEAKRRAAIESNKRWSDPVVRKHRIDGIKKAYTLELIQKRRDDATKQMQDPEQIQIRKEKSGLTENERTEEQKEHYRIANDKKCKDITLIKREALRLAENKCARCGKTRSRMAVHHIDGYIFNNRQDNLVVLCPSCHSVVHGSFKEGAGRFFGKATVANQIGRALDHLGIDLTHPDLNETPQRIARVWEEFTVGKSNSAKDRMYYILHRKFPTDYDGIIILSPIDANSLCPHHFLPVKMEVHFAYIPNGYAVGLSKITEFIMLMSKQPILQEHLAKELVDKFMLYVKPKGVMVVIKGEHSCMTVRDTRQKDTVTITSEVRGVFSDSLATRQEAMSLISMCNR